jgi:hypothetical protein
MPKRVNAVEEGGIIKSDNKKFLCTLIHVAEAEKRNSRGINFSEAERDKLISASLDKLNNSNLIPDFYLEKWPRNNAKGCDTPYIHLTIEFYKKIKEI